MKPCPEHWREPTRITTPKFMCHNRICKIEVMLVWGNGDDTRFERAMLRDYLTQKAAEKARDLRQLPK